MTRSFATPASILAALLAACATTPRGEAGPTIRVTRAADGAPLVEYLLGDGARTVALVETAPEVDAARRDAWAAENDCADVANDRITVRSPRCTPRFRVTWDGVPRDRVYPPLITLRNGGVLVFTAYPQVRVDGVAPAWRIEPPPGQVARFRDRVARDAVTIPAGTLRDDARGWIYIGPDRFATRGDATVLVDDGVPAALEAVLEDVAARLIATYTAKLGTKLANAPSFYLEWSRRDAPGRDFQADVVSGNVIRFGLNGSGWATPEPQDVTTFREIAAHEIAHFWNSGVFRSDGENLPWLHEGNAELLAAAALLDLGLIDAATAAAKLETAMNDCLVESGTQSWSALKGARGTVPYRCGMALQFALAAASGQDAFAFWRGVWAKSPTYDETAVLAHVEREAGADRAAPVRALLGENDVPLREALPRALAAAGVRAGGGGTLPAPVRVALGRRLFAAVMQVDCGGSVGFFTMADHLLVEDIAGCATFAGGQKVRALEGHDLFERPVEALRDVHAACAAGRGVRVGLVEGDDVRVPCDGAAAGRLPAELEPVRVDAADVARVLAGGSPAVD